MIGFKNTNNKVQLYKPAQEERLNADDIIYIKGIQTAQQVLMEYFSTDTYPLLRGEDRDAFFIKKLRKIKERYFDEI